MVEDAPDTLPAATAPEPTAAADASSEAPPSAAPAASGPSASGPTAAGAASTGAAAAALDAGTPVEPAAMEAPPRSERPLFRAAAQGAATTSTPAAEAVPDEKPLAAAAVSEDVGANGSGAQPPRRDGESDLRGRWTIKSVKITPELLTAVRKAADRAGMKQGDWIADRLFRVAVDELKRETLPGPTLEDAAKALAEIRARLDEPRPDPRIGEIAETLKSLGEKIERPTRSDARMGAMMDYMVEMRNEVQRTREQLAERRAGFFARLFGRD